MEEKSRAQELSVREISLIRELAQIRKEHKRELEYENIDGYELPPRTQFSMLNKPAVSIKYGVMKFNMACRMMINGIQFIQVLLEANGLAAGKDHQFKGRYDAEKNAVIISLEKDEQSALSPQKCTT